MAINPKRGEIWQVNLEPTIGQEIKKSRPAVVIGSDLYTANDLRIAKAVRTLCQGHLPWHPEDSRIELFVYEFDFSTMTSIAQSC